MRKIEKEILEIAVLNAKNLAHVMKNLKRADSSAGRNVVKRFINEYEINIAHFETTAERCERLLGDYINNNHRKSLSEILTINSNYTSSSNLKEKLYREGIKERKCEKCGQDELWRGDRISLILDHKNGIHNDNRLENLQILCPNCNAALLTHCRGAKGLLKKTIKEKPTRGMLKIDSYKKRKKYLNEIEFDESVELNEGDLDCINRSHKYRRIERPPHEQLINEINELGFVGTGKKYGVSDNAIRNWIKFHIRYPNK